MCNSLLGFLFFIIPSLQLLIQPEGLVVKNSVNNEILECITEKVEARLRTEIMLCSTNSIWKDSCSDSLVSDSLISFDPIVEQYEVQHDILGDEISPTIERAPDATYALNYFLTSPSISKKFFQKFEIGSSNKNSGLYYNIRTVAYCSNNYNKTIDRITAILTLGIVRLPRYNSGWKRFAYEFTQK